MTISKGLDLQTIVDGMAHAVLLFDAEGRLRTANKAAQALFGADFKLLRSEGWAAAAALFNSRAERTIDQVTHERQGERFSDPESRARPGGTAGQRRSGAQQEAHRR